MARPGPCLNIKTVFPKCGIPMLKIRRSQDRLIFNMGIPILLSRHLYIATGPRFLDFTTSFNSRPSALIKALQCAILLIWLYLNRNTFGMVLFNIFFNEKLRRGPCNGSYLFHQLNSLLNKPGAWLHYNPCSLLYPNHVPGTHPSLLSIMSFRWKHIKRDIIFDTLDC